MLLIGEVIVGVQDVVPQELPQGAVERVGAGADHGVDDAADGMAKFGVEVAVLQLELLDSIRRGRHIDITVGRARATIDFDVIVDTVQAKIGLPDAGTLMEK
jgi:hypothetical protein